MIDTPGRPTNSAESHGNTDDSLDIDHLKTWIGRREVAREAISPELVRRLCATLDLPSPDLQPGDAAPLGIQWCLAPAAVRASELGPDGHPRRGGFLPPVPLPRRMWAGGDLMYSGPLRVGETVERNSRIEDVTVKTGRTGPLCFVSARHEFLVDGRVGISERHDIVYRSAVENARAKASIVRSDMTPDRTKVIDATSTLLFRYSALTFNGHRIHYDRPYCLTEENYPGLVVHGPLQATLLLNFASEIRGGATPSHFSFRSIAPLFDGASFVLNAAEVDAGLRLWTSDDADGMAMFANAVW